MDITVYEGIVAGIYADHYSPLRYAFDVDLVDPEDPDRPPVRRTLHTNWVDPADVYLVLPGNRLYYMEDRSGAHIRYTITMIRKRTRSAV